MSRTPATKSLQLVLICFFCSGKEFFYVRALKIHIYRFLHNYTLCFFTFFDLNNILIFCHFSHRTDCVQHPLTMPISPTGRCTTSPTFQIDCLILLAAIPPTGKERSEGWIKGIRQFFRETNATWMSKPATPPAPSAK